MGVAKDAGCSLDPGGGAVKRDVGPDAPGSAC